jgi:acetylglutamate kinase
MTDPGGVVFERIEALTEILPYVREFQGGAFVIKLGGEVCRPAALDRIAEQVSLVYHVGIRVVLVHGGGPQLDEVLGQLGIPVRKVAGRRVTDDATLRAAQMVYRGLVNTDVVAALRAHGTSAVGLSGADAGLVVATRRPPRTVDSESGHEEVLDFGHVGDVSRVQPALLETLWAGRTIPVVCSLAADAAGNVLNVNGDTMAAALAVALKAQKLILLTGVAGILRRRDDPGSLVSYAAVELLRGLVGQGVIAGGMVPKVEACLSAVAGGVPRTHIIDGTRPGALLLELFSNQGCGTMIVNDAERRQYEAEMGADREAGSSP